MPGFADGLIADLRAVRTDLQGIRDDAKEAEQSLKRVRTEASEVEGSRGTFQEVADAAVTAGERVAGLTGQIQGVEADVRSSMERTTSAVREGGAEVEKDLARMRDGIDTAVPAIVTRVDDLLALVRESGSEWDKELALQIEALQAGLIRQEEFLAKWGEGTIRIGDETKKIRDLLAGVDFGLYEDQLREYLERLRTGQATVTEALEVIERVAPTFARRFLDVVRAFQAGEVTLERVREELAQLEKVLPDSGLADLADELAQKLGDAAKDGSI